MPSDTRTESARPRFELPLTTLVVSVFLGLVLLISAITFGSGYLITRQAIEADVERYRNGTEQIARLTFSSWFQDVRQLLDLTVQEGALRAAMERGDGGEVEVQLTGIYYSQEEGTIDILFAHLFDSDLIVDVGIQTIDAEELRAIAFDNRAFAMTDRVLAIGEGEGRRFVVLSRRDVVDPDTGRVLGSLYGGIVLDDNVNLMSAVSLAAGASVVRLNVDGRLLAPYYAPGVERPDDDAWTTGGDGNLTVFRSTLPIEMPGGDPLVLISGHELRAVQQLGQNYRTATFSVVAGILVVSLIAALLLRHIARRATASLDSYVAGVNRHDAQARFDWTAIREFNEVGQTLSRFVTAFRESEARAQAILNNASASIAIKSVNGVYTFVNREFEESMGMGAKAVIGRRTSDIFPPDAAETIDRNDQTVIELKTSAQFEAVVDVTGTFRAYVVTKFPLVDVTGAVTSVCSIASDITPLKLSERALTDALAAAENASQAKSRFLATMSHEFRTPLNAILGFSDLIRNEYMGPAGNATYVDYADDIHKSGQQMLELVDEILDMAAIEAGQRQFDRKPVDLGVVIAEGVNQVQHMTVTKDVTLSVEIAEALPPVLTDHRAALQILQNLLSNAIKFTRPQGRIVVSAHPDDDGGVVLRVADSGIGMAAEVVQNITEPFYQDKSDPHLAEAGTGLGLSIVKSIVEAIGGRLEIESELAQGTRVSVTFPKGTGSAA